MRQEEFENLSGVQYDFFDVFDGYVSGLGLPRRVFESSCRVADGVLGLEGVDGGVFRSLGGFDVLAAVSVFLGARCKGVPVSAERVYSYGASKDFVSFGEDFSVSKLRFFSHRFGERLGLDLPVFTGSDLVDYCVDGFSFPVGQSEVAEEFGVSCNSVRRCYKSIVEELTGVDASGRVLDSVELTAESFGFFGGDVRGFALMLAEDFEGVDHCFSSRVVAAACVYIASSLLEG